MKKQTVLISGGGVPGLALALSLAGLDLDVTLAEPNKPPPFDDIKGMPDGRTVAIQDEHVAWLNRLGVWERVAPYTAALKTMRIIDDSVKGLSASKPHDFNATDAGKKAFMWNTPLSLLRSALWEKLPPLAKESDSYDLIIAADGRNSPWHERAGIHAKFDDTGQAAIVCAVEMDIPHNNVSTEFQRENGPVTFVPLPHARQCSVVFVDKKETQETLLAQGADAVAHTLSAYMPGCRLISTPSLLPLSFMGVDRLYKDNIVLMAEAAHVLHPMGAQGLNLSLKDAAVLSSLLHKAVSLGMPVNDPLHVMAAYAKAREKDHALKALTIKTSLEFLRQGRLTGGIRRGVLNTLDALPGVKRFLLQQT